ncbi:hypothetical protein EVG20_g11483 [Dentipellis fragilis]|uniref:Uncharacterized protein n=1 Tax=Dentipellis fragilis TaxID=205917 RepID=A0A4Y9XMD8_9AGAM|nr:hypothetical protein EVG20_g11483 [Dentipellis fragilis]
MPCFPVCPSACCPTHSPCRHLVRRASARMPVCMSACHPCARLLTRLSPHACRTYDVRSPPCMSAYLICKPPFASPSTTANMPARRYGHVRPPSHVEYIFACTSAMLRIRTPTSAALPAVAHPPAT